MKVASGLKAKAEIDPVRAPSGMPDKTGPKALIIGCGNILRGDDGFGPAVVKYIEEKVGKRKDIEIIDAGLGTSRVILDISLTDQKPKKVILVDSMRRGKRPGELYSLGLQDLAGGKGGVVSMHAFPGRDMLEGLEKLGTKVVIIGCEAEFLPDVVSMVMSKPVAAAVPKAAELALSVAEDP